MGELFKACFHQLEDGVAKFIDDMKERRKWEHCGVSPKTVSEHWDSDIILFRGETRKAEIRDRANLSKFLWLIMRGEGEESGSDNSQDGNRDIPSTDKENEGPTSTPPGDISDESPNQDVATGKQTVFTCSNIIIYVKLMGKKEKKENPDSITSKSGDQS